MTVDLLYTRRSSLISNSRFLLYFCGVIMLKLFDIRKRIIIMPAIFLLIEVKYRDKC